MTKVIPYQPSGTQLNATASGTVLNPGSGQARPIVVTATDAANYPITTRTVIIDLVLAAQLSPGATTRVSIATDGTQGDWNSDSPAISANGRYVAFYSDASSLVLGDTNQASDVFVHDRDTGATTRVSVATNGTQGNSLSHAPMVRADGRHVAFTSGATNLWTGDSNGGANDSFVHDRMTGVTTLVSMATNGAQGGFGSESPVLSADGRYVAFYSANNLVAGDNNHVDDVFVHDRNTGATTRVSVANAGRERRPDVPAPFHTTFGERPSATWFGPACRNA